MKKNTITKLILITIVILAVAIRFYKLGEVPPSISWDEAAFGYNAWTIANYGRDEYGKFLPLYFKSFGDAKHPIHIYITALSVKFLGLNEFSTRLPAAIFGALNVLLIYFLAILLFQKQLIALFSAFFIAISPYNIHFSRFNHEANFVLFFYILALVFFFYSIKKHKKILVLSALSFAICFITYHTAKIVVPITILILLILYWKEVIKNQADFTFCIIVGLALSITVIFNSQLLGIARANQTSLSKEASEKTLLYQFTKNEALGKFNLIINQYSLHFKPDFLFITGDKNPRLSSYSGQFYKIEAFFLLLGFAFLIYKRNKEGIFILTWVLIAPIPSSLASEAPHAARASFMMGGWHIVAALGVLSLYNFFNKPLLKKGVLLIIIAFLFLSVFHYLNYYFKSYAKDFAIEWQYGMKQIVEFVKEYPEYVSVFMTDARSQPYIFFLYYLKPPLDEYLYYVTLNNNIENKSYNTVASFGRFSFGGWNTVESFPENGILYIITPSQYDGLLHRSKFEVKKLIKYPNGLDAFYLVSKKNE